MRRLWGTAGRAALALGAAVGALALAGPAAAAEVKSWEVV